MDKDTSSCQDHPLNHLPSSDSPRKSPTLLAAAAAGDRLKRDEWSEGAVSALLEAYESKWILRNRAKLKGHDWEDVARSVSSRANCTRSPKTQTQCKNKIESMKKRYRSESAATDGSSWPLYPRLDLLLRGSTAAAQLLPPPPQSQPQPLQHVSTVPPNLVLLDPPPLLHPPVALPIPISLPITHPPPPPPAPPPVLGIPQNSHGSNGIDRAAVKEDGVGLKNNPPETDSSTPALYSEKSDHKSKKVKTKGTMKSKKKMKKGGGEEWEIAESIRWLAEAIVRSEQSRMETMKEVEKMRIEAEAKRGEMDLKRTEIIANTQLEIARIFAAGNSKGVAIVDPSLRIGRN